MADGSDNQGWLAKILGYANGSSVSKIVGGRVGLDPKRAARLDEEGYSTSLGCSYQELAEMIKRAPTSKHDVFLAGPMASSIGGYSSGRGPLLDLAETISEYAHLNVYFAGRDIPTDESFDMADIALDVNLSAIETSKYFVLFLPESPVEPSSVWVEAGVALHMGIPSLYFIPDHASLPYMLRLATRSRTRAGRAPITLSPFSDISQPMSYVKRHGPSLFELAGG